MKVRAMSAPTLKCPEEREFVVDAGASMHMLSRKISSQELDTLRRSRNPTGRNKFLFTILISSWQMQLLKENACCSIAWKTLRRPRVFLWLGQRSKAAIDQRREDNMCKTDHFVPLVVLGLCANSGSNSSSTPTLQDLSSTSPAQERRD